jgi:hypothetical protein
MDRDRPLCEGTPWYIGQLGGSPVPPADVAGGWEDGAGSDGVGVDGLDDGAWLAVPEQPVPASASRTINAHARMLPATP